MKPLEVFKKYHKYQRVSYSGPTSYGQTVEHADGTICALGNSITIELDESLKPYREKDGCTALPPKQYANISAGDLKTQIKKIMPI